MLKMKKQYTKYVMRVSNMNIRDLDKAFSEIFNEIEQMNEEQIKK